MKLKFLGKSVATKMVDHRERTDKKMRAWMRKRGAKFIANMELWEIGYIAPWAVGDWDWLPYPSHLDGLNLCYPVFPVATGVDVPICRTEDGWVVNGKLFKEPR